MAGEAVSAQAHIRFANVKVAGAAGCSQNKGRDSLGIALLPPLSGKAG
ncbi:MAG: hypothetical protein WBI20_06855 [Burkholderiaceae bacterium]